MIWKTYLWCDVFSRILWGLVLFRGRLRFSSRFSQFVLGFTTCSSSCNLSIIRRFLAARSSNPVAEAACFRDDDLAATSPLAEAAIPPWATLVFFASISWWLISGPPWWCLTSRWWWLFLELGRSWSGPSCWCFFLALWWRWLWWPELDFLCSWWWDSDFPLEEEWGFVTSLLAEAVEASPTAKGDSFLFVEIPLLVIPLSLSLEVPFLSVNSFFGSA